MKTTLRIASTTLWLVTSLIAGSALARITYSSGTGTESGYCTDIQGFFCINDLRQRADRRAEDQARWSCQSLGGRPLTYTTYCSGSCFPNIINPGSSSWVNCNSNCNMQCEID